MVQRPLTPGADVAAVNANGRPTEAESRFKRRIERWFANFDPTRVAKLIAGAPAGDDKGAGAINAQTIYENDKRVFAQGGTASAGVTLVPYDHSTPANGTTITPNPSLGLKQKVTNNVAGFTVAATAEIGDCELQIVNGSSAGTIAFSGFEKKWPGDALDTVNGNQFVIFIFGFEGKQAYAIKALQ